MSQHLKDLREKQNRLATAMRAIVASCKADNNRGLTIDEQKKFDDMQVDYSALENSLKANSTIDAIEADLSKVTPDNIATTLGEEFYSEEAKKKNAERHAAVFTRYLRSGLEGMTPEDKQVFRAKFHNPAMGTAPTSIQNAQTITTTGGGYLIPQGFSNQLEEAMKWFGGILGNTGEFTTETGQPLPWPTDNDTAQRGRILGVNTQLTETDIAFGQVTFNAYIFTSDSVLVPLALIEDSYFDINGYLVRKLGTRLGRALNYYCTVGTGTGQPNGIVTAAVAAGNVVTAATGETTSLIYNDLVNLLHSVDPAYRAMPTAKFMFADTTLQALRLLKDTAGRPLWQPGITAGFGNGYPETILDKPFVINQDMATMAANAYPMLFGDMGKYMVRRVASGVTILRLVERYADYLQVGFLGFLRADGQLLDAGTHPIAVLRNSAT